MPGERSAFPDWASVFIMGLAFWIGARTSQGAITGTWLRCHDEVSTVQNISPESSTKWDISVSPYFR